MNNKLRVLHILASNKYSGAENVACTIIDNFKDEFDMTIINKYKGDEAFALYHVLTGGGTIEFNKGINEVLFQLKCIKEHLNFISKTDMSVNFDIQVLDGCISEIEKWIVKR